MEHVVRAGLTGRASFHGVLPVLHTGTTSLFGWMEARMELLPATPVAHLDLTVDSFAGAFKWDSDLVAPLTGSIRHIASLDGATYLFDNRGDNAAFYVLNAKRQATIARRLGFTGAGQTTTRSEDEVQVNISGGAGGGSGEFEIAMNLTGGVYEDETLGMYMATVPFQMSENLTSAVGMCYSTPPANLVLEVLKGGAVVGNVTISNNIVSFTFPSTQIFDGEPLVLRATTFARFEALAITLPALRIE